MTKSEHRVLHAIQLLDQASRDEYEGFPEAQVEHYLHGFKTIEQTVHFLATGRKSSQREISRAIAKLVDAGVLEKKLVAYTNMYIRRESRS